MSELIRASEELVGLAARLRATGLRVTYPQVELAAQAIANGQGDEEYSYWALRSAFTSSPEDARLFDSVWSGWQSATTPEPDEASVEKATATDDGETSPSGLGSAAEQGQQDGGEGDEQTGVAGARYSVHERLRNLDFNLYGPEEERLANAVIRRLAGRLPEKLSRRQRQSHTAARLDFRRTLHRCVRTGGHPVDLAWSGPRVKPRRLVILVDISGSMQTYAAPVLVLAHALRRLSRGVEVFTFGTRLTHLSRDTLQMTSRTGWSAALGSEVPDWAGGTRIGTSLAAYNRGWGRQGMSRGAVVIIVSDGWERQGLEEIETAMAEIQRYAYRTIWLNPLAARPGYEPLAGGMATALPYIDVLLPAASIADLEAFTEELAQARYLRYGLPAAGERSGSMRGRWHRR